MRSRATHPRPISLLVCLTALCTAAWSADPPPQAADSEPVILYTVVEHDTLIGFARDLLVDPQAWPAVARLNKLANPNVIRPGQVLRVPSRLLRSTPVVARLVSVEGEVSLSSIPATVGAEIQAGQELATGANGSAVVELADGSRVKVAPASSAGLDESARFSVRRPAAVTTVSATTGTPDDGWFAGTMRLVKGSIEVFATKVLRAKPLEVRSPTAVVGVRGTTFRVRLPEDTTTGTLSETLEGQVMVSPTSTPEVAAVVAAGFGAATSATGAPTVRALLPAPDLSTVPEHFERPLVRFAMPSESRPLQVQVAADASFDRIVSDQRVEAGSDVRIAGLADGAWHVRARRIDDIGLQGIDAARPFVLKARPEPPATVMPRPRAKLQVGNIEFAWAENVEATRYELEVLPEGGAAPAAQRRTVMGARAQIQLDAEGSYRWRLASVRADGDQGPWSDAQAFELRAMPAPPTGAADNGKLQFNWGGRPQDKQQIELARDAEFTQIFARADLQSTEWTLPNPGPGTYYFHYRSIEPDGYVSGWSSTLKVEVKRDWSYIWMLLLPLLGAL